MNLKYKNRKLKKEISLKKRKNIKEVFENFNGIYKKESIGWNNSSIGKEI